MAQGLARADARASGQPLLQQFGFDKIEAATETARPAPSLPPPPLRPSSPNVKRFPGFKECGARPIEAFNGRKDGNAADVYNSRQATELKCNRFMALATLLTAALSDSDGETIGSSTEDSAESDGMHTSL